MIRPLKQKQTKKNTLYYHQPIEHKNAIINTLNVHWGWKVRPRESKQTTTTTLTRGKEADREAETKKKNLSE